MQALNVISKKDIQCLYQPIFNLASKAVIGAESLMRGPDGLNPGCVFEDAKNKGFFRELDYLCLQKGM